MWLIDTKTMKLKELFDPEEYRYAVFSHTWGEEEVSFQEFTSSPALGQQKAGYIKITKMCEKAREMGIDYAWADTCCIDKTSSAALTEAINSMYEWYKYSSVCITYLEDLPGQALDVKEEEFLRALKQCRWFTRGWTLQELIAPESLKFYDAKWNFRGSKTFLRKDISVITGIDVEVLEKSDLLSTIPVGKRMSWASGRVTTRREDIAYCLLGIFGVNMPMLYGEGHRAFFRLQEEIAKTTNDLSLFAWSSQTENKEDRRPMYHAHHEHAIRGILARSPDEFVNCRNLEIVRDQVAPLEFNITNNGLRIDTCLAAGPLKEPIFALNCTDGKTNADKVQKRLGIYLMKTQGGYVRSRAYQRYETYDKTFWAVRKSTVYVKKDISATEASHLRKQLQSSLMFHFALPRNYQLVDLKGNPSSDWDSHSKLFITGDRQNFTACVEFKTKPNYWRFVIVCGLISPDASDDSSPPLCGTKFDHEGVVPWVDVFTDQDPSATGQLEIIDRLKGKGGEGLIKLRNKVLGWHLNAQGQLPLMDMNKATKFANYDDGEIRYFIELHKMLKEGIPVFDIWVHVEDFKRVPEEAERDPRAPTYRDEDPKRYVPSAPEAVPDYGASGRSTPAPPGAGGGGYHYQKQQQPRSYPHHHPSGPSPPGYGPQPPPLQVPPFGTNYGYSPQYPTPPFTSDGFRGESGRFFSPIPAGGFDPAYSTPAGGGGDPYYRRPGGRGF